MKTYEDLTQNQKDKVIDKVWSDTVQSIWSGEITFLDEAGDPLPVQQTIYKLSNRMTRPIQLFVRDVILDDALRSGLTDLVNSKVIEMTFVTKEELSRAQAEPEDD